MRILCLSLQELLRKWVRGIPLLTRRQVERVVFWVVELNVLLQTERQIGLQEFDSCENSLPDNPNETKDTHVRQEGPSVADDLPSLLRDLQAGLAVVATSGDDWARGPQLVDEVGVLSQGHRVSFVQFPTWVDLTTVPEGSSLAGAPGATTWR